MTTREVGHDASAPMHAAGGPAQEVLCGHLVAPAEWGVGAPVPVSAFDDLDDDALVVELQEHQRLAAWLAAREVTLVETLMRRTETELHGALDEDVAAGTRTIWSMQAHRSVLDEVTLATGAHERVVLDQLTLACDDPSRTRPVREALACGLMSWQRATTFHHRTAVVPVEKVEDVLDRVLAPYPARSVNGQGGLAVPAAVFTRRLTRAVAASCTDGALHRRAVAERDARAQIYTEDVTGSLMFTGHAARIAGAYERIDAAARTLRTGGDTRTLAQLRSDIGLDLLLAGQLAVDAPATTAAGALLPPARVHVVISAASLLGLSDEPGSLACGSREEDLPAHIVREVALAAGSTWRRLVTDPATGYLADLSTTAYAVTGHLRERVTARDRVSRVPGSTRPARRCDIDHDVDHALGGPSSESNTSAKNRHGHNHKTRRHWTTHREPGVHGTITWTTPTGRTYETRPWDYRDPDPPSATEMWRRAAALLDGDAAARLRGGPASRLGGDPASPLGGDPASPLGGDPASPLGGDPASRLGDGPASRLGGDPVPPLSGDPASPRGGMPRGTPDAAWWPVEERAGSVEAGVDAEPCAGAGLEPGVPDSVPGLVERRSRRSTGPPSSRPPHTPWADRDPGPPPF